MTKYVEVLINVPLSQSFTYSVPQPDDDLFSEKKFIEPEIGMRVEVTFGSRQKKITAFVINTYEKLPENFSYPPDKIKPIIRVLEGSPLFNKEIIELAFFISRFYICSPGEALSAMLPSGKKEKNTLTFPFEKSEEEYKKHELSDEQKTAIDGILNNQNNDELNFHYLYGKTGSGKTEVFLSCAEKILSEGKGVIYLVPEIGLTHQVIKAVIERFGQTVAVLHSGLTPSQRLSEYHRILNREAKVVIGARSAVFAPVPDLGLIIIDEEHDSSYKSNNTPRYHARQVAMVRCQKNNIPLVMGSATPSAEAYEFMKKGTLKKHILTKRLAGGKSPSIETIDLSQLSLDGSISPKLEKEINTTLQEKKQTILFLNRRGFTHFFKCQSCGYELKCKNCSVPMTYHKNEKILKCHYCGWSTQVLQSCPECGSLDISYSGFGTEFIENEVKTKFPNAVVKRVDTDIVSKKGEFEKILDDFREGKIDILLGTQMVAKGLNFPKLKLVGIILADTGLHLPDFRASEKTFALLVQVAGRAGRFFPDGKVLVQTYNPGNPAIYFACNNDIEGFYEYENEQRKLLNFPPFSRLTRLVFRSGIKELARECCNSAFDILKSCQDSFEILGPAECPLEKIAANYRYQIILRGQKISEIQNACKKLLYDYKTPNGVYIEVDVDPVSLL